jgi:hypothetical protein
MDFIVSSTGYDGLNCFPKPETRSTQVTDSIQEAQSPVSSTDSVQETQPIVPSTGLTQETQTTSDISVKTTFLVFPQDMVINVSDTFSILIFAENVTDMYSWQIALHFNPKIVECINVSVPEHNVFSNEYPVSQALIDYNSTEFTKKPLQSIKNNEGSVLAGDCLLGSDQATFFGSGFLCQVTFKAISAGVSDLTLYISSTDGLSTFYIHTGLKTTIPSVSNSKVTVLFK